MSAHECWSFTEILTRLIHEPLPENQKALIFEPQFDLTQFSFEEQMKLISHLRENAQTVALVWLLDRLLTEPSEETIRRFIEDAECEFLSVCGRAWEAIHSIGKVERVRMLWLIARFGDEHQQRHAQTELDCIRLTKIIEQEKHPRKHGRR
mgnify:CR=1 FL=1